MEHMFTRTVLYRLLRDEETPMDDGIVAKCPLGTVDPMVHIRYGSRRTCSSQWISTSRDLSAIDKFIKLKRKKEGMFRRCRVVKIDAQKLQLYAGECEKNSEVMQKAIAIKERIHTIPMDLLTILTGIAKETTGQILDFNDQIVMDTHIPVDPLRPMRNDRARGYARKYKEVLVERFIPAACCIAIYER